MKFSRDTCDICQSPHRVALDKMLLDGVTQRAVMQQMKAWGVIPQETNDLTAINFISKHKVRHVTAIVVAANAKAVRRAQELARETGEEVAVPKLSNKDAALLVRDMGVDRLIAGDLTVTVAETLRAQELLDKRAQHGSDSTMMAQIFVLLSGGVPQLASGEYVEGEFREEQEEDETELRALMAPAD